MREHEFYEVPKVPPIRTFAHFDWVDDFTMTQEILREGIVRLSAVIKAFAESDENLRLLSFDLDVPELAKTRRLSDGRAVQLPSGRVKGPGGEFSDYADWLKNG